MLACSPYLGEEVATVTGHYGAVCGQAINHDGTPVAVTGKRQHNAVTIAKRVDKSTPLLFKALCQNEPVESAELCSSCLPQGGKRRRNGSSPTISSASRLNSSLDLRLGLFIDFSPAHPIGLPSRRFVAQCRGVRLTGGTPVVTTRR